MIGNFAFCCFPIDIAVRFIGTLKNTLVFIALVSDSDEVLTNDKFRIIFGFDSKFFAGDEKLNNDWFSTFCLIFTILSAFSSALLIWASIIVQRWLTVPWLITSSFNVICHFTSLMMLSLKNFSPSDEWVTAFTVLYSVALLYFTLVVMAAHYAWWIQFKIRNNARRYHPYQDILQNMYASSSLFERPEKNQT